MDLANYNLSGNAEAGFSFFLVDPITGKNTDVEFTVFGSDSRHYRRAKTNAIRESIKGSTMTEDEISAKVYAQCVKGWSGLSEKGKDIAFDTETTYHRFNKYPWIMDQVSAKIENRLNFTKPPKKS